MKEVCLSLTGEQSHKINIPVGQGSLSIGTIGLSQGDYDVWVDKDSQINWDAFNQCFTGFGQAHSERYPFGDWPRFLYYSGSDQGFIKWSMKRKIEDFHWFPTENAAIDLSKADITSLFVHTVLHSIHILIEDNIRDFFLSGRLEHITIEHGSSPPPYLYFSPLMSEKEGSPYQLPVFPALKAAASVNITVPPIGSAFDCSSLLQFHNLTALNLSGNLIQLDTLSELTQLERIGLRYVPNLSHMPRLANWVNLKSFIGYNVEETKGKLLRAELNKLLKEKEMEYSSVTKLRKAIWFCTEYGIPFSSWDSNNAKFATRAYKACLKQISKAQTENQVQEAIVCFIGAINGLTNIETGEREDVWTAVTQLTAWFSLELPQKTVQKWFDAARNF